MSVWNESSELERKDRINPTASLWAQSVPVETGTDDNSFAKFLLNEGPQLAGGIGGGIVGAQRGFTMAPPTAPVVGPLSKPIGGFIGGTLGAFGGGAVGEGTKQIIQTAMELPEGPNSVDDSLRRLWDSGKEEAIGEAGGQALYHIVTRAFSPLRGKASQGIDELMKLFHKYGGEFTAPQKTEAWLVHQLDGLTRGSLTGSGTMKRADRQNVDALLKWQDDLSTQIAATATKNLTDRELGQLVINTLEGGKAAHSTMVNNMYSGFDDLVVTKTISRRIKKDVGTGLVDTSGKEIHKEITQDVIAEIKPVKMDRLIGTAEELAAKISAISGKGDLGISDVGKGVLLSMRTQAPSLKFSDAQYLRTTLLDIQRGIKLTEPKLAKNINSFVDEITKAMDNAASLQGSEVFKQYQNIKKFASSGYSAFNDKFIVKLLETGNDAQYFKIGEMLFKEGQADNVLKLKGALRKASFFTKKSGGAGNNYDEVINQIKQGYLESFLQKSRGEITSLPGESLKDFTARAKATDATKMINLLSDKKTRKTMDVLLNKKEKEALFSFIKAADRVQGKIEGGLGMVMQLAQGGAIVGAASGWKVGAKEAATLFIGPKVMAHILTKPKWSKLLIKGLTTEASATGPAAAGAIGALVAQLTDIVHQAEDELGIKRQQPPPQGVYER